MDNTDGVARIPVTERADLKAEVFDPAKHLAEAIDRAFYPLKRAQYLARVAVAATWNPWWCLVDTVTGCPVSRPDGGVYVFSLLGDAEQVMVDERMSQDVEAVPLPFSPDAFNATEYAKDADQ